MQTMFILFTRLADKAGTLGGVVSTIGCAMCFPAMAGAVTAARSKSLHGGHLRPVQGKITELKRMERVLSETVGSCSGEEAIAG